MGQIGFGNHIFGQILHFHDLQLFTYDKNFTLEAHDMQINLFLVNF